MMEFKESRLKFTFNEDEWQVIQFDKTHEYIEVTKSLPGVKAVDFIAQHNNSLHFFEIKNFRGYGHIPANQQRVANSMEELTTEIAQKVKDSLALVVALGRSDTTAHQLWRSNLEHLTGLRPVIVTAWIEEDTESPVRSKRKKSELSIRLEKLKKKLKWLTSIVTIENVLHRNFQYEGFNVEPD
jgi:hypothetical protein